MIRRMITVLVVVAACMGGATVCSQNDPEIATGAPPAGELVCRIDRDSAVPGQPVRLTGLVRAEHDFTVREVWHRVIRVATLDKKTNKLKNLDTGDFEHLLQGEQILDGLPRNLATPGVRGVLLWDVQSPRVKGIEFEFRPREAGIFMIYTKWELTNSQQQLESQPVILTVRPAADAKGPPIRRPN